MNMHEMAAWYRVTYKDVKAVLDEMRKSGEIGAVKRQEA